MDRHTVHSILHVCAHTHTHLHNLSWIVNLQFPQSSYNRENTDNDIFHCNPLTQQDTQKQGHMAVLYTLAFTIKQ